MVLAEDSDPPATTFDGRFDHKASQVHGLQNMLFFCLFVDSSKSHIFMASDSEGNGFVQGAYAKMFRNGESKGTIEGDFGTDATIVLGPNNTTAYHSAEMH